MVKWDAWEKTARVIQTMKSCFLVKGYSLSFINDAIDRTSKLTQDQYLEPRQRAPCESSNIRDFSHNFITTFNKSHNVIKDILNKHWSILCSDPHLNKSLPKQPRLTFKGGKTLKNFLAPSRLHPIQSTLSLTTTTKTPGCYRCNSSRCKNCRSLPLFIDTFFCTAISQSFSIKRPLDCSSTFVIYLLECPCKLQYVGRTIMTLRARMNKHRHNVCNAYINHSVSCHALTKHNKDFSCFKLICIEQIPETVKDHFGLLCCREISVSVEWIIYILLYTGCLSVECRLCNIWPADYRYLF